MVWALDGQLQPARLRLPIPTVGLKLVAMYPLMSFVHGIIWSRYSLIRRFLVRHTRPIGWPEIPPHEPLEAYNRSGGQTVPLEAYDCSRGQNQLSL